jgi:hypothetical protein
MEKDFGRIKKNDNTEIVVRVDDFGGKPGITIREFVMGKDGGYSGFTKSGTRVPAEKFLEFREAINSISLDDLKANVSEAKPEPKKEDKKTDSEIEDY